MDVQLGRNRQARRAYGLDEIALAPGRRTLDPSLVDTHFTLGGIQRQIPIIASAMDGVVDVRMAILLSELGAFGVLNLDGIQTRYADPDEVLDQIASVGKDEFVPLMQRLYSEPVKPELIQERRERKVRAPQEAVLGNAQASGRPDDGKRHRNADRPFGGKGATVR